MRKVTVSRWRHDTYHDCRCLAHKPESARARSLVSTGTWTLVVANDTLSQGMQLNAQRDCVDCQEVSIEVT